MSTIKFKTRTIQLVIYESIQTNLIFNKLKIEIHIEIIKKILLKPKTLSNFLHSIFYPNPIFFTRQNLLSQVFPILLYKFSLKFPRDFSDRTNRIDYNSKGFRLQIGHLTVRRYRLTFDTKR